MLTFNYDNKDIYIKIKINKTKRTLFSLNLLRTTVYSVVLDRDNECGHANITSYKLHKFIIL